MAKSLGMWKGIGGTLLVLIAVFLLLMGTGVFSVGDSGGTFEPQVGANGIPEGVTSDNFGKAATLKASVYDIESDDNAQVAATIYYWAAPFNSETGEWDAYQYVGSTTSNATGTVTLSGFTVGSKVKAIAFDSTYAYGVEKEVVVKVADAPLSLDTSKASTSQTLTLYDEDGDSISSNVTVGTTNYILEKLRIQNADDKSMWKAKLVGFDYAESTNISEIRLSGAEKYTGEQIKRLKNVEEWFLIEANLNDDMTRIDTGDITIVPDGDNVASETLTVYVIDAAPFITVDNQLAYGVQKDDSDRSATGVADKSASITLI